MNWKYNKNADAYTCTEGDFRFHIRNYPGGWSFTVFFEVMDNTEFDYRGGVCKTLKRCQSEAEKFRRRLVKYNWLSAAL